MRTLLVVSAAAALASSLLLTGCPLGCGAWDGAGDTAYQRGSDRAVFCSNGGFSGTINGEDVEGRAFDKTIIDGATGGFAFTFDQTAWSSVAMDQVALDHADVMCQDLAVRSWWTSVATVPVATALVKGDATILLCPDGTAKVSLDAEVKPSRGTHDLDAGRLHVQTDDRGYDLQGMLSADGSFTSDARTQGRAEWTATSVDDLSMSCE